MSFENLLLILIFGLTCLDFYFDASLSLYSQLHVFVPDLIPFMFFPKVIAYKNCLSSELKCTFPGPPQTHHVRVYRGGAQECASLLLSPPTLELQHCP